MDALEFLKERKRMSVTTRSATGANLKGSNVALATS